MIIFLIIFLIITYFVITQIINEPKYNYNDCKVNYVFASTGGGKTTTMTYLARKIQLYNKRKKTNLKIYCTEDLKDIEYYKIYKEDFGHYELDNGICLIDEASILFNNRKQMTPEAVEFFKKCRHRHLEIWIFSQSNEDVEVTIRRLAKRYYYLKKSILFPLNHIINMKQIKKGIEIDKNTRQIIDGYDFIKFSTFRIYAKSNWKYFDSYEYKPLKELPIERKITNDRSISNN